MPCPYGMQYPQRKTIRLQGYDYRESGIYFCTICVHRAHRHKNLFGHVDGEQMLLNRFGRIVEKCWLELPFHCPNAGLDEWMVMSNHFHGLLQLNANSPIQNLNSTFGPLASQSLSSAIGSFKSAVTKSIGRCRGEKTLVWQMRFHDRIVRNEPELTAIRRYIRHNPAQWANDRCHPQHPDFERVWQNLSPDPDTL